MEISLRIDDVRHRSTAIGRPTMVGAGGGSGRAHHVVDVVARVEPGHRVGALLRAIDAALGLEIGEAPVARFGADGRATAPLDRSRTVVESGLVSGDGLVVGALASRPPAPAAPSRLVVASGPDAGRSVDLRRGPVVVGRDDACDLVLSDPQVSRRHVAIDPDPGEDPEGAATARLRVLAPDRNEVRSDGTAVVERGRLVPEQVLRLGASTVVLRSGPAAGRSLGDPERHDETTDVFGQVPFHRTPYFPAPVRPVVIPPLREVPRRPEASRLAYLSALLPVLMGVSFAFLLGNPRYLLFAAFSPVMVIGNWLDQRRRSGRDFARSVERFEEELAVKADEVKRALAEERACRFTAAPDIAALADRASDRRAELWVRDRSADDFGDLRVGIGDLPAEVDVRHHEGGDADYQDRVLEAYGETAIVTDVPVTVPLARLGAIGLVGRPAETTGLASSLVLQAACLHSPEDLVIAAAVAPGRGLVDWMKWLPHTRSTRSPLAGDHLVERRAEADALVAELLAEAGRRHRRSDPERFPWLLVVLDRVLEPDAALVSRLLDLGPAVGLSVIWATDRAERIPRQASAVVDCRPGGDGWPSRLTWTDPDADDRAIDLDLVGPELALATARALAPVRDASSANAVTAIPRVVPLFTALGASSIDTDEVVRRWRRPRGHSLPAPIGHTESGPLVLDLVEHGPHGLIGGTSGSGKSELLMSLVAGLLAENPPSRVNVLFIDYKGGASSDAFRRAPHTVGYVTNLDGLLARRALTSLRAELNRRMNLLQGRAKDLAEMIERHPDEAPPSLVIVVDEFATLVKEIPDFVDGMVDLAQRGRSLGIHLLLATQRPSGAVNDNITANTNLRISLRMLDGSESSSVIGAPDAAAIPTPLRGRGYAKLGSGDLVAFQSAWSGAPLLSASGPPPIGIAPFAPGRSVAASVVEPFEAIGPTAVDRAGSAGRAGQTQLDALLDAVTGAADRLGQGRGRAPWLEVLPEVVALEEARAGLPPAGVGGGPIPGARLVLGLVDDPDAQAQYPATVDLGRSGGLLVSGAGGSGKTTALITAVVSAALDDAEAGGGHLTVVGIDVASRELVGLNRLPQCAAVATGDDLEAVTRVIERLDTEFERRRNALAEAVARSAPPPTETVVLLAIDGVDALLQILDQGAGSAGLGPSQTALQRLLAEGRQVGIHPLLTTTRPGALRAGVSTAISSRLVLRQADAQGYGEAGIPSAVARDLDLAPGQGFLDGGTLVQVASLVGPDTAGRDDHHVARPSASTEPAGPAIAAVRSEADRRGQRNREALDRLAAGLVGRVDPRLVTAPLPRHVSLASIAPPRSRAARIGSNRSGRRIDALRPVVGLADLTGRPYALDLRHADLSIVGDPRSGRSTLLAAIGLRAAEAGAEVWVVAPPGSPLAALPVASRRCLAVGQAGPARLEELADEAAATSQAGVEAGVTAVVDGARASGRHPRPRLLLVDDHDLFPEHERALTAPLERLLGSGIRWVAAGARPRGFSASPVAQRVRAARSCVYLRPHDPREAHEVVGLPVPWHPGLPMVEGRGLAVVDRVATIVQFARPDEVAPAATLSAAGL